MLRRALLLATIAIFTLTLPVLAQDAMEDVVYLKNGGVIRGTIVEQVPGKTVKIKTRDGNVFVYSMDEIDKMTKEESRQMGMAHPSSSFDFSLITGGAVYDGFYFGTGVRIGATLDPGFYIGATIVNHFTDEVSVSYLGADIGFNVRADKITIQPYASLGTVLGGGESAFYVSPAFALYVWATPDLAIGPDVKYVIIPDLEDGFGGIYLALMYRL